MKAKFHFEPKQPITSAREFTDELAIYCQEADKTLTILKEGMEPTVLIDGKKYVAMLQQPVMVDVPVLPIYAAHTYGFKWVYFYPAE